LLYTDKTGIIGNFLNRLQLTIAGEYALFVPFLLILWGVRILFFPNSQRYAKRTAGACIIIACLLVAVHILAATDSLADWQAVMALAETGGGIIGALGSFGLYKAFGLVGGVVVLVSFSFIGMFLVMNISLRQFV